VKKLGKGEYESEEEGGTNENVGDLEGAPGMGSGLGSP